MVLVRVFLIKIIKIIQHFYGLVPFLSFSSKHSKALCRFSTEIMHFYVSFRLVIIPQLTQLVEMCFLTPLGCLPINSFLKVSMKTVKKFIPLLTFTRKTEKNGVKFIK